MDLTNWGSSQQHEQGGWPCHEHDIKPLNHSMQEWRKLLHEDTWLTLQLNWGHEYPCSSLVTSPYFLWFHLPHLWPSFNSLSLPNHYFLSINASIAQHHYPQFPAQYTKMTKKIQLCRIIYYSLAALHVSSDIIAYHQEHLNCNTASGIAHCNKEWAFTSIILYKFQWQNGLIN
jgi:hypothetical protein